MCCAEECNLGGSIITCAILEYIFRYSFDTAGLWKYYDEWENTKLRKNRYLIITRKQASINNFYLKDLTNFLSLNMQHCNCWQQCNIKQNIRLFSVKKTFLFYHKILILRGIFLPVLEIIAGISNILIERACKSSFLMRPQEWLEQMIWKGR